MTVVRMRRDASPDESRWQGDTLPPDDLERDDIERAAIQTEGTIMREANLAAERISGRSAETIASVLDWWRTDGPLIHEPTDIGRLDEMTGGGPVYGSRWFLAGAPDAGKTAFLIQLAHVWASRGVHVGVLAVDEEPSDLVGRLAQRRGYPRTDTEIRDAATLERISADLSGLPIVLYDSSWTIEDAAADLARGAGDARAALLIDSVQTVTCNAMRAMRVAREPSEVQEVTANCDAIRKVATHHRLIAVATSELGRSSYASDEARRTTSTLAGGKWSGKIEYSARVLLGLRSVAGEPDLIDIEIAKNKHGPRDKHVYLRIDRRSQCLWQVDHEPPPSDVVSEERAARKQAAKEGRSKAQLAADVEVATVIVRERPGIGAVDYRAAFVARTGGGQARADRARAGAGVVVAPGRGRAVHYHLPGAQLPAEGADS